jgi:hypothetical protein
MKIKIAFGLVLLAFMPALATAETAEERQACMNDAFTVCGEYIPDRDRVAACLARNVDSISAACRTVMLRYQEPAAATNASRPAKAAKGRNAPLNVKPKKTASKPGARS